MQGYNKYLWKHVSLSVCKNFWNQKYVKFLLWPWQVPAFKITLIAISLYCRWQYQFLILDSHFSSCELLIHRLYPFYISTSASFPYRFITSLYTIHLFKNSYQVPHRCQELSYTQCTYGEWKHIWFLKKINWLMSDRWISVNQTRTERGCQVGKTPIAKVLKEQWQESQVKMTCF